MRPKLGNMGYATAKMTKNLMIYRPRNYNSDDPIVAARAPFGGPIQYFMRAAQVAGVAVVWEHKERKKASFDTAMLIGRAGNIDRLSRFYPTDPSPRELKRLPREVEMAAHGLHADGLGGHHSDEWLSSFAYWDKKRVGLLLVQHKICELYPEFRIWREGGRQPGQEEVWLKRSHGGRHLGGCVWTPEYYTSGQCLRDLKIN